jgi:hypothetical protein
MKKGTRMSEDPLAIHPTPSPPTVMQTDAMKPCHTA